MKTARISSLKKGEYFKRIIGGKPTEETYTREEYDRCEKRFVCSKHSDVWGDSIYLAGKTTVAVDFTY